MEYIKLVTFQKITDSKMQSKSMYFLFTVGEMKPENFTLQPESDPETKTPQPDPFRLHTL